jgi:hypothetical protein
MALDPFTGTLISGGISAIAGLFGGSSERSAQQAALDRQYKYDKKVYKYNWKQAQRDYKYAGKSREIAIANENAELGWREATAQNDYNHSMAIRNYEYNMQMKAYNKSEQTFRQQLNFNNIAAQVAMESENRFLEEQSIATAFENQDLFVQALETEGKAAARGQSGRSAGKTIQAVLAQVGRNQAILAESLVSAEKQYNVNLRKISADKYGADIAAEANRMIKPELAPALPKPIPLPRSIFQKPQKPRKPPKPIRGTASGSFGADLASALGTFGSSAAYGAIKWG